MTFYGFEEDALAAAEEEISVILDGVAEGLGRIVYTDLASRLSAISLNMGWNRDRAVLGRLLGRIAEKDREAGRGLRTALVVSGGKTGTFEPNSQFYKWARDLGYDVSDPYQFLLEQYRRVYQEHWKPPPRQATLAAS
jgi:hypothetical protein